MPIKPGMLHRNKVREVLARGLDYPLIMVEAGPGYGKTQAVSMFAADIKERVIWLNLTQLDNDTDHFWNTLVAAIHHELPGFAEKLRQSEFPRTIREFDDHMLSAAGALALVEETVLVIDNYSLIKARPIRSFIENIIRLQLARLCVILIVNRREDSGLGETLVGRDYCQLKTDQLRFSAEEAKLLFGFNGVSLHDSKLVSLLEETEGWPLAVYLICQQRMKAGNPYKGAGLTPMPELALLFENGFFLGYDLSFRKLLVSLSFLPAFSSDMISTLAPELLEAYTASILNNVFISYDYNHGVFNFHRMYQEFLRHRRHLISRDDLNTVYEMAGDWFFENGRHLEAIECYYNCGNYEKMIQVVLALPMSRRDTTTTDFILKYLKRIPHPFADSNPYVIFALAFMYLNRMEINKGRIMLNSLKDKLEKKVRSDEESRLLGEVYTVLGDICLLQNEAEFFDYYGAAQDHFINGNPLNNRLITPVHNNSIFFIPGREAGQLEDIVRKVKAGADFAAHIFQDQGYGYESLFEAEASYAQGHLEQAREHCARTIYMALDRHQHDIVCNALFILMMIAIHDNDYNEIQRMLASLLDHIAKNHHPTLEEIGDYAQGWLYLVMGMPNEVARWIAEYDHIRYALQPISIGRNKLIHAYYLLEKHRYRECLVFLEGMEWVFREKGLWTTRLKHYLLKAICLNSIGNYQMAVSNLHQAYEMAHNNNVVSYFVENGNRMRSLINLAIAQNEYPFDGTWLKDIEKKAAVYMENIIAIKKKFITRTKKDSLHVHLSKREMEVLRLMAIGLTRSEISKQLGISVNSVKTYIAGTYNKLGAINKADAIRLAHNLGIYSDIN